MGETVKITHCTRRYVSLSLVRDNLSGASVLYVSDIYVIMYWESDFQLDQNAGTRIRDQLFPLHGIHNSNSFHLYGVFTSAIRHEDAAPLNEDLIV